MTYLKLFLTMGLTWSFEVIVWFASTESSPAPDAIISISNFLNILQVNKRYFTVVLYHNNEYLKSSSYIYIFNFILAFRNIFCFRYETVDTKKDNRETERAKESHHGRTITQNGQCK